MSNEWDLSNERFTVVTAPLPLPPFRHVIHLHIERGMTMHEKRAMLQSALDSVGFIETKRPSSNGMITVCLDAGDIAKEIQAIDTKLAEQRTFRQKFADAVQSQKDRDDKLKNESPEELRRKVAQLEDTFSMITPTIRQGAQFSKSQDQRKRNGALGGKQVNVDKIARAKAIIEKGTRKIFNSSRQLAAWLTENSDTSEQFRKNWVLRHLSEYIKK